MASGTLSAHFQTNTLLQIAVIDPLIQPLVTQVVLQPARKSCIVFARVVVAKCPRRIIVALYSRIPTQELPGFGIQLSRRRL